MNPMADLDDDEDDMVTKAGKAKVAAKQQIKNSLKRSVTKIDMTKEFKQSSFTDAREKIINLSKKSGLR